ncbi:hypothetical protein IHE44_0005604, partial [Lamprotornis superbus]
DPGSSQTLYQSYTQSKMIDLSFLTEEEQEAIMKVLQRDAELKRTEEERVRHLPEKVKDHVQLKNMSGQWFYEAKSKRHRDKIHGADIIRASMRRKPATIAEVGQNKMSKAKISWVNNINKEVLVPPDLHSIVEHQEEEQQKTSLSSKEVTPVLNKPEERPVKAAVRQRRNPFNSIASDDNLNSEESEDRPAVVPHLSKKEIWSLSEDSPPKSNLQNDGTDKPEKPSVELTDESQKELVKRPVPKARKLIHKAADSVSQREDLVPKPAKQTEGINGIGTPPRGILKRSSSSSSTDSEIRVSQMLVVQKKNGLSTATIFEGESEKNSLTEEGEDAAQNSLEKLKQVRFSSSSGKGKPLQSPQLYRGKEKGEHDILKPDKRKNSGNYAVQSHSLGDKQISVAKPLETYSSTLQMKTVDDLEEETSASSPCDSSRPVFPVGESFRTNTVTPKKLGTPQKTSSNILSNSNNEHSFDETHEKKSNQILSHESESHKNFTDGHQLSAETEAHEVSNTNSTSLQQEKSVAPAKASGLSSAVERMLKEASETPSPKPKNADSTVQGTAEVKAMSTAYEHDGGLLQGFGETTERSALSSPGYRGSDLNFQNPQKEVSEAPASVLENMDKKIHDKIQTSIGTHVPHQRDRDHPQEIQEIIEKTSVSNIAKFEFSHSLEKLLQEASAVSCPISEDLYQQEEFKDHTFPSEKGTLFMTRSQPYNALSSYDTQMKIVLEEGAREKYVKASVNDLAVSEIEASGFKRDGAINKIGERIMVPVDLHPLEGKTNMVGIKPFEINKKEMNESTFLEASEQNSEFRALVNFRRASTPLKDESDSSQPEESQFCLMSQHEDNNEEEGNNLNLGSKFSDGNSDSHSGTKSSARSEEELNPVLMALKRSADRKKPSKSLEDIPSATSNKEKINKPKEELVLSAEDVSTVTSQPDKLFSNPEKLKGLSKSVPSFLQEEVSGSLMSIYSADFGNVDVKGNIQFAIDYVEKLNELHIFICQCKDLAVADVKRQRSDPYVKTYLLPEKYRLGKRKTSVKKKTFNPVYNEILRYKIEKELLKNQSLNISVWHNDTFGRNSFLGEVELDLGAWDWNDPSNKQINWFPLKPRTSAITLNLENRGEMKLALQYVPHPIGGKKTLSTDTSRKSRQKTRTVAKTTNPVFNHTMVYDGFRPEDLKEACIELTVWDHNKLANHFLGGLRIGLGTGKSYGTTVDWMDSTSDETALWEKMMNSPNTWIEDTLPLRMLMVAKLTK